MKESTHFLEKSLTILFILSLYCMSNYSNVDYQIHLRLIAQQTTFFACIRTLRERDIERLDLAHVSSLRK